MRDTSFNLSFHYHIFSFKQRQTLLLRLYRSNCKERSLVQLHKRLFSIAVGLYVAFKHSFENLIQFGLQTKTHHMIG